MSNRPDPEIPKGFIMVFSGVNSFTINIQEIACVYDEHAVTGKRVIEMKSGRRIITHMSYADIIHTINDQSGKEGK